MSTSALHESFDAIAEAYDRARPAYPGAVFDRILAYADCQRSLADVLEIGTGTGKATRVFAELGHRMLCLEPGPNLAQFARTQFADLPNVVVEQISFEDWLPADRRFDIAFSAQAFHWLDPHLRLDKLASVIRPGGVVAVFGHSSTIAPSQVNNAIRAAYCVHAPALEERDNARAWYSSRESPVWAELNASSLFVDVDFHAVEWVRDLFAEEFCALAATYSDHATMPTEQRRVLLDAVAEAVRQNGGIARIQYTTALFLARAR